MTSAPQQGVASPRPVAPGLPQMTNPYQALTYADYLQTAHWRETRKRKLMAVGCKCARCDNYRGLEVHHLTYERLGAERMDDLEVLCPDCHRKAHGAAWPGGGPGSPRTGANGEKVKSDTPR